MVLDNSLINKNTRNQCFRDILVLLFIALVLGTYLILTTVVISKDSVTYLHRAQWLQDNPTEILAERPSGYEVLILLSYRIFYAITGISSVQGWIWAAQGLTLLCRALAIVVLYLVGCLITHRKHSFWGCVILLFLPEPAHWGSDALREWPYLLFMALSVLSLLWGVRKNRVWPFVLTGLFAGAGFLIRLESIQLVLLGLLVLLLLMLKPPKHYTRPKALIATVLLIAGFAVPILVYANYSGQITNNYLKQYIGKVIPGFEDLQPEKVNTPAKIVSDTVSENTNGQSMSEKGNTPIEKVSGKPVEDASENTAGESLLIFAYELYKDTGELLVWFYLPFWIIGIYVRLRDKADPIIRCIIGALILMGIGMLLMRYFYKEAIITQRWVLPLVAITAFYIYSGIEQFGLWAERKKAAHLKTPQKWSRILVTVGILICCVKVIEPLGVGNRAYLEAANWIKTNTLEDDWFYTYDKRIPFYAKRHHLEYDDVSAFLNPYDMKYLVVSVENIPLADDLPEGVTLVASFYQEEGEGEEFLIYRCNP